MNGFLIKKTTKLHIKQEQTASAHIILHLKDIPHGFLIFVISEVELSHL